MTIKKTLISMVLLLIIASSIWMIHVIHGSYQQPQAPIKAPNSFMTGATYTRTNSQGQIIDRLTTSELQHFNHGNLSLLTRPHLIIYDPPQLPWVITADRGVSKHQAKEIILQGHVIIEQQQLTGGKTVIKTTSLTIFPARKYAQTDQAVTITQPDSVIHSQGLIASLTSGNIRLITHVRGEYDPEIKPHA